MAVAVCVCAVAADIPVSGPKGSAGSRSAAIASGAQTVAAVTSRAAGEPTATMPSGPLTRLSVVVFDFTGDEELGKQLADSIRLRLARHKEYDVVDQLTTQELAATVGVDWPREKIADLTAKKFACSVGICGSVKKKGDAITADVRCVNVGEGKSDGGWSLSFSDGTQRARGVLAMKIAEAILGEAEWTPPQYGDEPEPKNFGKPLNVNGSFDEGAKGWDRPDHVSTFIEDDSSDKRGIGVSPVPTPDRRDACRTILRVRTDLARDPWLEYTRNIRLGLADPDKPPKIARDTSYDSVAGLEGVHFRSDWLEVKQPGLRYWLTADFKPGTEGMAPKIFVKGYRDCSAEADGLPEASLVEHKLSAAEFAHLDADHQKQLIADDAKAHPDRYRRECYRWYLACRSGAAGEKGGWEHFAAPVPPRGGLPKNVQWLQIQIYSYWPPGDYKYKNVFLYADPAHKGAIGEEPARTPNFMAVGEKGQDGAAATEPAGTK
jgi:hypothetical protein